MYLGIGLVGILLTNPPRKSEEQMEVDTNPLLSLENRADEEDALPHYSCRAIAVGRSSKAGVSQKSSFG